jgi:hypothetical protein
MTEISNLNQNLAPFQLWGERQITIGETGKKYSFSDKDEEMREVLITNKTGNLNPIFIGSKDMTQENCVIVLNPDESAQIKIDNLRNVYYRGTAGEKINFVKLI